MGVASAPAVRGSEQCVMLCVCMCTCVCVCVCGVCVCGVCVCVQSVAKEGKMAAIFRAVPSQRLVSQKDVQ